MECCWTGGGIPLEWGGKEGVGGVDSKSGLQWEGRGHVPVCLRYGMADLVGDGLCRVLWGHSLPHCIRSCWGWTEWEDEGRKEQSLVSPKVCRTWSWTWPTMCILPNAVEWSAEARLHRLNEWALGGGTLTDTENWGINKTVFLFFFFIKKGVVNRDENQEASIRYTKRG